MSSEWKKVTVEDIASSRPAALSTGPFGSSIGSKHFLDFGFPVIRGSNLSSEISTRLSDAGLVFVSPEKAKEFQRSIVRKDDLVFTCWGTINQVGYIDDGAEYLEYIVSNKQMKLTLDKEKAYPLYIYYVFSGPEKQREILDNGIGSSVPGFNLGQLKKHEIFLPPLAEQKSIAALLGNLDDRITLLRKTNATLEAIAQALFKSWFVDFDPVHAKQQGRAPEGMEAKTAALFPDSFEESNVGMVPKGWLQSTLVAITKLGAGFIQTGPFGSQLHASDYQEKGTPVVMPQDLEGRRISTDKIARVDGAHVERLHRHSLQIGDVVFSRRGDVGRHALVTEREIGWLCGTGCLLVRPGAKWPAPAYISQALGLSSSIEWLKRHAVGATMPNLNTGILGDLPILLPGNNVLEAFERITSPLEHSISSNDEKTRFLGDLRDTILPRLISGQLSLPEAQALVEEVKLL